MGWQNSNWLGALRKFEIRWKPGVVLYPTRFPDLQEPEGLSGPDRRSRIPIQVLPT